MGNVGRGARRIRGALMFSVPPIPSEAGQSHPSYALSTGLMLVSRMIGLTQGRETKLGGIFKALCTLALTWLVYARLQEIL